MMPRLPCFSASEQPKTPTAAEQLPDLNCHTETHPVDAWKHGKLTMGFSGGGFLLPYHLGVYQSLAAMGIAHPMMPMAGSSAGALVVASVKAGLPLQQQMESFFDAAHDCRINGLNGRLRSVLKGQLQKCLPPDAAVSCSDGSCWVSITQVIPRPSNKLYGGFADNQALVKALLASCHLPRISDGGIFTSYKSIHKRVFDGGFSNLIPVPPAPPLPSAVPYGTSGVVRNHGNHGNHGNNGSSACTAEQSRMPDATAFAACNTDVNAGCSFTSATSSARSGNNTKGIRVKFSAGRQCSSTSSSSSHQQRHLRMNSCRLHHNKGSGCSNSSSESFGGCNSAPVYFAAAPGVIRGSSSNAASASPAAALAAESCSVSTTGAYTAAEADGWFAIRVSVLPAKHMQDLPAMFNAPTAEGVAVAPDKYQDWPHDLDQTTKLALYPQDDEFLWEIFERGRADAVSWARDVGFPADITARIQGFSSESDGMPVGLRVVKHLLPQQWGVQQSVEQVKEQQTIQLAAAGDAEAQAVVTAAMQRASV